MTASSSTASVWRFDRKFFVLTIILFVTEVLIAVFVRDSFIRPYFGDYLVVILMYCAVKSFLNVRPVPAATTVLLFAYAVEILQYFHIVDRLGLTSNTIAKTVIGYGFAIEDIWAYTLGAVTIIVAETLVWKRKARGTVINRSDKTL